MNNRRLQKTKQIWKKMNEMTAEQFVQWVPYRYISLFTSIVLSVMATIPVLMSLFFQKPTELFSDLTNGAEEYVVYSSVFGAQWYQNLLLLGFLTSLVTILVILKRYHASGLAPLFKISWMKENLLPVGLVLLLVWSVFSALLSNNWRISFLGDLYRQEGLLTYFFYATIFVAASQLSERHMKWVAEVLCVTCAATGILVIVGNKLPAGWFFLEEDLRAVMFHQYNHYGYFLAICFPVCVGLVLSDEKTNVLVQFFRIVELWIISNAIAFNSVRGSFVAILTALAGWNVAILVGHRSQWRRLLVVDFVFAATILKMNTGSTLLERMDFLFKEVEKVQQALPTATTGEIAGKIDNLGTERVLLWRLGIQFALEKPLFGHGPDNLGYMYTSYREIIPDRPHNELIQIAASLGFPALVFYVTAIASHIVNFFKCFRKLTVFHLALFASVGCYLVSSMFGNSMYYTTPYYFIMLAFTYRICKNLR